MKIPISSRLLACARFVCPGDRVADVGCDHGYLGIFLLTNGIARSVIAADINEGPLNVAFRNAHKYGVADRMTFYRSDGLRNIPSDFDSMVCAGMGADTIISILEAAPWLRQHRYRLILQCQSKTFELRRYLSEQGWYIAREAVLRDGRFLYTVMTVSYEPEAARLTQGQWYFPPAMLKDPGEETAEYYHRTLRRLRFEHAARGGNTQALPQALRELEQLPEVPELAFLKEDSNHDDR